ncbi:hypothetical protein MBANPS3_003292 [Mucor bainieri]
MSPSELCKIALQFSYNKFNNLEVHFPTQYMPALEDNAKESLRFRLFLHVVKKLEQQATTEDETHIIKLCLSRIVSLLNKTHVKLFKQILGNETVKDMLSVVHTPLENHLSDATRQLLLKNLNKLPNIEDMLILHQEKAGYLKKRSSQVYQTIVILEYLLNSFDIRSKSDVNPSELTSYRRFIPILELVIADTDISVKERVLADPQHLI